MLELKLETQRLILLSTNKPNIEAMMNHKQSNYYKWFGDQEVNKYNSHGLFPQSQKELDNFFDRCENDKSLLSFMIIEKESKNHIGMISLQRIDYINRSAEFAVVIGEKDCWSKGYTTEACQKLFYHGFMKIGLNRIWSGTSVLNTGMVKVFEKLGMRQEGVFRQGQFLDGYFRDGVSYGILRNEYDNHIEQILGY